MEKKTDRKKIIMCVERKYKYPTLEDFEKWDEKKKKKFRRSLVIYSKEVKAKVYRTTKNYMDELEYEKTAPKRNMEICRQCECFVKSIKLLEEEVIEGKYNCEKHSPAVVQEEIDLDDWATKPVPKECPYYVEMYMMEWNGKEKKNGMA